MQDDELATGGNATGSGGGGGGLNGGDESESESDMEPEGEAVNSPSPEVMEALNFISASKAAAPSPVTTPVSRICVEGSGGSVTKESSATLSLLMRIEYKLAKVLFIEVDDEERGQKQAGAERHLIVALRSMYRWSQQDVDEGRSVRVAVQVAQPMKFAFRKWALGCKAASVGSVGAAEEADTHSSFRDVSRSAALIEFDMDKAEFTTHWGELIRFHSQVRQVQADTEDLA